MELEAAKMIGAGRCNCVSRNGVGIGIIFGNYLSGAMRNPSAAQNNSLIYFWVLLWQKRLDYSAL